MHGKTTIEIQEKIFINLSLMLVLAFAKNWRRRMEFEGKEELRHLK
jgi:hypothetical protein